MSIRRFFQIAAFLATNAVSFFAPLATNADACPGADGGEDCYQSARHLPGPHRRGPTEYLGHLGPETATGIAPVSVQRA